MGWYETGFTALMAAYTLMLVMVSLYGLHRYMLVFLYYRHRRNEPQPARDLHELPRVTVQLPMFNEQYVAGRIIEKACEIDYPKDKLQIQVLDDSIDETCEIARQAVEQAKAAGFDVEYLHRDDRTGYKAGALCEGMKSAKGEFITIFDADFQPDPQILKRSMPYFTDPDVCVVQTRWAHLNRNDSLLTRSQAIYLDGHFAIEHVARNRSNRFMSFNGTAGTWRRCAIEDAGGWQHDTLTEDLDLSYRAQLRGWKFIFLPEVAAPAELPPEMIAFKAQQFRWTKGGTQTAIKLLPKVLLSKLPLKVKVEAFFHLTCFSLHIYMLLLVLMLFPAMFLPRIAEASAWRGVFDLSVFTLATLSASLFYVVSQHELMRDWRNGFKYLPMLMALGVGLCVSNSKAIIEALFGRQSEFVRTPKYGSMKAGDPKLAKQRSRKREWLPYVEFIFGLYMFGCLVGSLMDVRRMITAPFLAIFSFGFFYVSVLSFQAQRVRKVKKVRAAELAAEPVEK